MSKQLYMIANEGCDDTTFCMMELTENEYEFLKSFFEKNNSNSHNGCQPTINFCKYEEVVLTPETMEYQSYKCEYKGKYYDYEL